jgi:hypothetical protein
MSDINAPTVRLYIPKFGKVCDVNVADEMLFREQYQAIDEAAYLAGPAKATKANPFARGAKTDKEPTKTAPVDPTATPTDPTATTDTGTPPVDPTATPS